MTKQKIKFKSSNGEITTIQLYNIKITQLNGLNVISGKQKINGKFINRHILSSELVK